jgi:hypothetical protein
MWKEAARLAHIDGVWWTARVLRFKYESLKLRMERDPSERERAGTGTVAAAGTSTADASTAAAGERRPTVGERRQGRRPRRARSRASWRTTRPEPGSSNGGFIELPGLVGATLSAARGSPTTGTVIEVEDPTGTRLVVRLAKDARVDVTTLISVFRRCGRGA